MNAYNFQERLEFSLGEQQLTDIETIKSMLAGCVSVNKSSSLDLEKAGIDYIAVLRGGAEVYIDAKTRDSGCSKWWSNKQPELALEYWSVRPDGKYHTPRAQSKAGWTLSESKKTDLILFKFDMADCLNVYLISFQLLRIAFRRNQSLWRKKYRTAPQDSGSWESECVFVPVHVVYEAVRAASIGRRRDPEQSEMEMLQC